jgi:hypothetical protein
MRCSPSATEYLDFFIFCRVIADGRQKDGSPGAPHNDVPTPHVQGKDIQTRPPTLLIKYLNNSKYGYLCK